MDENWDKHIVDLQSYRKQHGHLQVAQESGPLWGWIQSQRQYYQQWQRGENTPLTRERIQLLEVMGFIWLPPEENVGITSPSTRHPNDVVVVVTGEKHGMTVSDDSVESNSKEHEEKEEGEEHNRKKMRGAYKTENLKKVYTFYDKCFVRNKAAMRGVNNAKIKLEQAKLQYEKATRQLKDAEESMEEASSNVLKTELEENPEEEWNSMYKTLVDYKSKHGQILFPKGPYCDVDDAEPRAERKTRQHSCNIETAGGQSVFLTEDAAIVTDMKENDNILKDQVFNVSLAHSSSAPNPVEIDIEPATPELILPLFPIEENGAITDKTLTYLTELSPGKGGTYSDAELYKWVSKMRKSPKRQLKKWRCQALDRLGMVWNQYDATWTNRYEELIMYKNKNDHTQVPASYPNLGVWVGTQRKQYHLMQQGKQSHMTPERIELLNKINFTWKINVWNERYQELKAFKENNKKFSVPTTKKQLRSWITTQRSHYRFLQEGKPSQMTQERIKLLEKIGFTWKTREDWQTRYDEYLQFINETGLLTVPMNCQRFPKLYRWINVQRMEYQKYLVNEPSRLKPEQISLLDKIGFE